MSWLSVGHFEDYVQGTKLDFIKSQYQTLSCIICTKWEYGMTQIHHLGNCEHTEGNWMWTRRIPKEMEHHWVLINIYIKWVNFEEEIQRRLWLEDGSLQQSQVGNRGSPEMLIVRHAGAHHRTPKAPNTNHTSSYFTIAQQRIPVLLDQTLHCISFTQSPSTTKMAFKTKAPLAIASACQPFGLLGEPTTHFFEWNSCKQDTSEA